MKLLITGALCSVMALGACDSDNPFREDDVAAPANPVDPTDPVDPTNPDDGGFDLGGGGVPPGVDGPNGTPDERIVRFEQRNEVGGGYAQEFAYDASTDTFTVDNLGFDGQNTYTRGTAVASLGPNDSYAVYDAAVSVTDPISGEPVSQIRNYRALVGVSDTLVNGEPRTSFAIVRTGGFRDFGFGGFVYQREGGVTVPTSGQAVFSGDYAGMRIFSGPDGSRGGIEFTEADMRMELDFADPNNAVGSVKGRIFNRVAFDINGDPIRVGNDVDDGELPLPVITFSLDGENGNINGDGEMTGGLISSYVNSEGVVENLETGTYYAILAGDATSVNDGGEIVGVLVLDSEDLRTEGVTVQETGGFILVR